MESLQQHAPGVGLALAIAVHGCRGSHTLASTLLMTYSLLGGCSRGGGTGLQTAKGPTLLQK